MVTEGFGTAFLFSRIYALLSIALVIVEQVNPPSALRGCTSARRLFRCQLLAFPLVGLLTGIMLFLGLLAIFISLDMVSFLISSFIRVELVDLVAKRNFPV